MRRTWACPGFKTLCQAFDATVDGTGRDESSQLQLEQYFGLARVTRLALFGPSGLIETSLEWSKVTGKKRPGPEQVVTPLRLIEMATSQGKSISIACREAGISDQSYYRWRKEYGGLQLEQAKRMKDLEKEITRLKRLVADLLLEKQVLKDIASGNL